MVKGLEEIPAEIMITAPQRISTKTLQQYYGSTVVEGLESTAEFPILTEGLLSRGYSPEEMKKIPGGNRMQLLGKGWQGLS